MLRKTAVLSIVLMIVATLLFAGVPAHSAAQDSTDDRVSALETQVAELEATVAALAGNSDPATETESAPGEGELPSAGTVADTPQDATSAGNLSGNAFEVLPPGNAGELAVVSSGSYDGTSLPLLLRNNTNEALVRVTVAVSVHDASGALLAVGEANDLTPSRVEPGAYVFGNAYFDFATFPSDVTYDFQASGKSAESASFIGIYDLTIQESSYLGDRIVGTAINNLDVTLRGPFGVEAACFGTDGSLLGIASDFAAADVADPGAQVPFQVTLYNVASCDIYLIGSSGYNF